MPIRPPALDDRSYADLVTELIERIPAHTPEWTNPRPGDPGRTLLELTARSVADALKAQMPGATTLIACGGGARNGRLMQRLTELLPGTVITSSAERGLPVDQVEAAAFAWLAQRFKEKRPGNLPAVTGAAGLRLLGCLYPA